MSLYGKLIFCSLQNIISKNLIDQQYSVKKLVQHKLYSNIYFTLILQFTIVAS